jgi:integrase
MPTTSPETQPPRTKRDRFTPRKVRINGKLFWQVQLGSELRDGRRIRLRRTFRDHREAETFAALKRIEKKNRGTAGVSMPEKLRADAIEADRILAPYQISVLEAAREIVRQKQLADRSETAGNAVTALLLAKKADGASKRYLEDLKSRLGRFVETFGERKLAEITPGEIADWLRALGQSPVSRNTFHMRLSVLFAFARSCRWIDTNPMLDVPRAKVISNVPGILTPEQVARLLESASEEMLPYFAIGAFCGLRSAELERLKWENVDFDTGLIEVTAKSSKTAARRFVTIPPNAHRWLAPYKFQHGLVCSVNDFQRRLAADRERAGIGDWPQNALRHSFASYHLAAFKDAPALSLELGHVTPQIVFQHYREVVTPSEAEKFWRIVPAVSGESIAVVA